MGRRRRVEEKGAGPVTEQPSRARGTRLLFEMQRVVEKKGVRHIFSEENEPDPARASPR